MFVTYRDLYHTFNRNSEPTQLLVIEPVSVFDTNYSTPHTFAEAKKKT
jgi:hypothetical protein